MGMLNFSDDQLAHSLKFYEEEETKDFTFVTKDGHEIRAHRTILAMKSPVFASMFRSITLYFVSITF